MTSRNQVQSDIILVRNLEINYLLRLFSHRYKQHLPKYTHEELAFPGVTVESVTVDKLTTFFDHFESLISNAVSVRSHKEAQSMLIKARQYRLNHKPFTFHITVNSDKLVKAIVRVFLGPKNDVYGHELDMSENYMNFMEWDQWVVDCKYRIIYQRASSFYEKLNIFLLTNFFIEII